MSLESKRLKNFFVKIIVFTGVVPLCFSFVFLFYVIKLNKDKYATYNSHEVYKTELVVHNVLTRVADSLHKVILSHELKDFLNSNTQTEDEAKHRLQVFLNTSKGLINNQAISYCIYGSQNLLVYGEKFCPKIYIKSNNNKVILKDGVVMLNSAQDVPSKTSAQFFFSAIVPFKSIQKLQPLLASMTILSNSMDDIKVHATLKTDVFDQKINVVFYVGVFICSLISLFSILYGIKIVYSLKNKAEDSLQLAIIGKMAHMLAHDIKKPFLVFANFMHDIVSCKTQYEMRDLIDTTKRSFDSSRFFIENLLDELIQTNEKSLNIQQNISLKDLISSCFETFSEHDLNGVKIITEFAHTVRIDGDITKLKRAFCNLIANAIDAIKEDKSQHGQIKIQSCDLNSYVRIEFYNSYQNFTLDDCERIFEPFYTTKQSGTGLGLFIVKQMIEMHQGKIFCASKESDGVYFYVDLPGLCSVQSEKSNEIKIQPELVVKSQLDIQSQTNIQPSSKLHKQYIFLIDDCPFTLRMWKRKLSVKYPDVMIHEFLNYEDLFDFIENHSIHEHQIHTIISDYIFHQSSDVVEHGLQKMRTFYSKKIYISTHMNSHQVVKHLRKFNVDVIDKDLSRLL